MGLFKGKDKKVEPVAVVYCTKCGNAIHSKEAAFCNKCGTGLWGRTATPAPIYNRYSSEASKDDLSELVEKKAEPRPVVAITEDDTPFSETSKSAYSEIEFRENTDKTKNLLRYGGPDRGVIVHHNLKLVTEDNNRTVMYGDGNEFVFYKKSVKIKNPEVKEDVGTLIKKLTEGFRKQNFDGWSAENGDMLIRLPVVGGHIEFAVDASNASVNRLSAFRDDMHMEIYFVVKISKKGERLYFYDGYADNSLPEWPNPENFVSFVVPGIN